MSTRLIVALIGITTLADQLTKAAALASTPQKMAWPQCRASRHIPTTLPMHATAHPCPKTSTAMTATHAVKAPGSRRSSFIAAWPLLLTAARYF